MKLIKNSFSLFLFSWFDVGGKGLVCCSPRHCAHNNVCRFRFTVSESGIRSAKVATGDISGKFWNSGRIENKPLMTLKQISGNGEITQVITWESLMFNYVIPLND